jgi:hypothetical protein
VPANAVPFHQARRVEGWLLSSGLLVRETFEKQGATDANAPAYIIGQSRSDTSLLYYSDELFRMNVATGVASRVDLSSFTTDFDSLYAPTWYSSTSVLDPGWKLVESREWNMEMDSAYIHQPHWIRYSMTSRDRILYAPTGSANSPMSGIVEHVLGFLSSKYVTICP